MKSPIKTLNRSLAALAVLAGACGLPALAGAQDFTAMINAQMAQMDAVLAQGQQQVNAIVQQKMQDPAVQAAYQQHVARAQATGQPYWNFETFAYNYAATGGFSADGVAAWQRNEAANNAKVMEAWQGVREAEANRAAAQSENAAAFSRNQNEFGNQLMGNSTFAAPNGYTNVLPHTWQPDTYHVHEGNTYYVDQGGRYYAYSDGFWVPLTQR
jgi:hypothetical protein